MVSFIRLIRVIRGQKTRTILDAMGPVNTAIYAKQIITPENDWHDGVVLIHDGKIEYVGNQPHEPERLPEGTAIHSGHYLIPGMIDIHINGSGGGDAAEGTRDSVDKISRSLAAHGTTAFLPTVITDHEENLVRSLRALADALDNGRFSGAQPLGIHLEGPFLNPEKRGAHRKECIQSPSANTFQKFFDAAQGKMKMLTFAPEIDGALEMIPHLRECLSIVSIGHSAADYQTTVAAIEAGANLATHIFNAMPELHHREPGIVGAVLDSEEITAEIIADGIHVHPVVVRLLLKCKSPSRVILVTDAISAADMPDGVHQIGNVTVTVTNGVCRDEEGRLAGSTLTMDRGIKNLGEWLLDMANEDLRQIISMATLQPARLLGLERKGKIEKGCDADLALLDSDLTVRKTWVEGELVYDAESR